MHTPDTICAIATAQGGAIGIVRVSGPQAITITERIFTPIIKPSIPLSQREAYSLTFGQIRNDEGEIVDEVLVSLFRTPHSYTGENSTEISCHGSVYILQQVMKLLIGQGCRTAEPGEFTQRAFLNGKMDLSQAEAVADLIASSNQATHRIAMGQLRGNISSELSHLRDRLLKMTSLMELELDFSDHEELEFADRSELQQLAQAISDHITRLTSTFASGQAIKQGIPVAIVGKTNVGKSTLLNLLVGEDKAIVSDIHGTTRDVIEDCTDIDGITFRFIDTAGMRTTDDEIERIGIERTYRKLNDATIVLWLLDALPSSDECEEMKHLCQGKSLIIVNNKTDLKDLTPQLTTFFPKWLPMAEIVGISAHNATNLTALRNAIHHAASLPAVHENDVILTSARHYESLLHAHDCITRVIDGLTINLSSDLLSEDLRLCLDNLAEITGGQITTDEVLGNIFKHFCIGK
ncbi:MAG: tRNA uridine-5-carboxymethylaminomethyl(34) synthesis GTPase MnmE [Clostridium sp.]|nr:tRNA uridine-5-carboxymethylaminomethyl(34) synthesis GTPase MnmE [Clostridium sp.]